MSLLWEQTFPHDCTVFITKNEKGTVIRIRTPRPNPHWLDKDGVRNNPKYLSEEKKNSCRGLLLEQVKEEPGNSFSYYTQSSSNKTGIKGSREVKEEALLQLIDDGLVIKKMLEKPKGRKTHELYAA